MRCTPNRSRPDSRSVWFLYVVVVAFLTMNFFTNFAHSSRQRLFETHTRDVESLVVGRLSRTRQLNPFSDGGFTGQYLPENAETNPLEGWKFAEHQHAVLEEDADLLGERFEAYLSHPGGQALVFSLLQYVVPLSGENQVTFFRFLTSLFSAAVVGLIVCWIYLHFGLWPAVFVTVTGLYSQWLTVFGKNLWWSLGSFYLPLVATATVLLIGRRRDRMRERWIVLTVFGAVMLKCLLTGFEYITTTPVMVAVPLVFYGVLDRWPVRLWAFRVATSAAATVAAVLSVLMILLLQLRAVLGGLSPALSYVIDSFRRRTYANPAEYPEFADSLQADLTTVLESYWHGTAIDLSHVLGRWGVDISYGEVVLVLLTVTVIALVLARSSKESDLREPRYTALMVATWVSILAPLSWFTVFKSHSFVHTHMNNIVWHMPFAFLAFALIGAVTGVLIREGAPRVARIPSPARLLESRQSSRARRE
ncbi:MAG: hypothetical protein ACC682_15835 [Gemmatimonadota bacterium]